MGFTDKMCYDVAKDIINNIFLVKYEEGKKKDKTWYENLNTFLVIEWDRLQEKEDHTSFYILTFRQQVLPHCPNFV